MNEFQVRALFENRFGDTPEAFDLAVEASESGAFLVGNGHKLELRVVNSQQAGWHLDGVMHRDTPPALPVLKPLDPARQSNGSALRAALS
jgi:hypothetical protein